MTDTREEFKPADNYEGLLIQAKALHSLRVSHEAMLSHYMAIDYSLSDAKMNELTECLESEKQMNHVLTNENESYKERIAELEKDAERYRHLRYVISNPNGSLINDKCKFGASVWYRSYGRDGTIHIINPLDNELDEAIDKAIAESKQ